MKVTRNRTNRQLNRKGVVAIAAIALLLFSLGTESAFARGGFRGGGFRMAPSMRTTSFGRQSSSLYRWGSSTPRSSSSSRFSTPVPGTRAASSAQRNLYESAQRNGTLFASKGEAEQAFRTTYGSQYGSRFATEPVVRPSYIPNSAVIGGRSVNILYNPAIGGYGYLDPSLGRWVLYDALANAATLNLLMGQHSYYWGGAPPMYISHGWGWSFFNLAFVLFIVFLVGSVALHFLRSGRRW